MTKSANKRKSGGASDDAPGLAPGAQKKSRKTTRFFLAGNCCECGDARCYELTKGFRDIGDPRGGHANIPKEPTAVEDLKSKPRNLLARAIKSLTRKLWVCVHLHLGPSKFEKSPHISRIHFHPKVVGRGHWDNKGTYHLPTHISKQLAIEIRDEGCSYSDIDKCPGSSSDYLPVPNYKWEDIARDLAKSVVESDPHEAAARIVILKHRASELMLQVAALKKTNGEQNAVIEKFRNTESGKRLEQYEKYLEGTGLTKVTPLSDSWHASHPKSARTYWGLGDWHNTVNM